VTLRVKTAQNGRDTRTVAAAGAVVAGRAAVPFGVDRSAVGRYPGADRRTYHLVAPHLAVDAETSFARRPRHADHGLSQRYQPTVYAAICNVCVNTIVARLRAGPAFSRTRLFIFVNAIVGSSQ